MIDGPTLRSREGNRMWKGPYHRDQPIEDEQDQHGNHHRDGSADASQSTHSSPRTRKGDAGKGDRRESSHDGNQEHTNQGIHPVPMVRAFPHSVAFP